MAMTRRLTPDGDGRRAMPSIFAVAAAESVAYAFSMHAAISSFTVAVSDVMKFPNSGLGSAALLCFRILSKGPLRTIWTIYLDNRGLRTDRHSLGFGLQLE